VTASAYDAIVDVAAAVAQEDPPDAADASDRAEPTG
jgi:hypothetical protein